MGFLRRLLRSLFRLDRSTRCEERPGVRIDGLSPEQRARLRENLRRIMHPKAS